MINFSDYQEHAPFITQDRDETDPPYPIAPFKEAIFEKKRESYIHFIQEKLEILLDSIQGDIHTYEALPDPSQSRTDLANDYLKAKEFRDMLLEEPPYALFYKETPKDQSGNCLGTDYVYDMYRTFPNFASIVKGMSTYEEYFANMFDDIHEILYQIFNKIGTRGQFYGYLDTKISDFISTIELLNTQLTSDNFETSLSNMEATLNDYNTYYNLFRDDIIEASTDMRLIVEPVVIYLNLLEQAGTILSGIWGNAFGHTEIDQVLMKYNRNVLGFTSDYTLANNGIIMQILEGIKPFINDDKSNFEMMMTKAVGTSFDEISLSSRLQITHGEFHIPSYPNIP